MNNTSILHFVQWHPWIYVSFVDYNYERGFNSTLVEYNSKKKILIRLRDRELTWTVVTKKKPIKMYYKSQVYEHFVILIHLINHISRSTNKQCNWYFQALPL